MHRLQWLNIIAVVVVLIHVLSGAIDFDCRRSIPECIDTGAKCNQTSGKCSCTDNFNYKCQNYVNRTGYATVCTPPCVHGTCDGTKKKCFCEEEYYGSSCEINRVVVFCTDAEMYIGINPIVSNFSGIIYELEDDGCRLVNLDSTLVSRYHLSNETSGYNRLIPHANNRDCKNLTVNTNVATTYNRTFYIQYSPDFKSSADHIIKTECKVYGDTDTVQSSYTVQWSERNIQNETITKDRKPQLGLYVLDEQDQSITTVILGARIKLKFVLQLDENTGK
ncbi:hypothetical protein Btru_028685 [Bulinus truncatus]|nr:hypothetical protein Btru_028685 [Bulinus truncatus]